MNVTICSRKAAEELLRTDALSHTAVISFCDPPSTDRPAPTPRQRGYSPWLSAIWTCRCCRMWD